ncbi:MAG: tRNA (adenosine(37)-N6)-threonylcarbamoyltransferase complex transferase subunit TsaD [Candidatus Melainabacteria bacterium]|nr:tRNA (adenosine(37)-N6)-threonylcarbamoyltransferase complex transferase subunit TsaD [Candidatus Melainabacteria bacterium]
MTVLLALETSCDETAAAIVKDGRQLLSSCLVSQTPIHQKFGGVVPEVAARSHVQTINLMIDEALAQANLTYDRLDGIACTRGPGLIGTLLIGLSAAKALSWSWNLPLKTVDHLFAHVCANFIDTDLEPPFVALLVSGGHTQILHFRNFNDVEIIGETLDDAAGEAYDKVGRLLGLGYPGGPVIDKLALEGNPGAFKFPEGVVKGYDFSFSGLKTAVLRQVEKLKKSSQELPVEDLCASFQEAVSKVLVKKTLKAADELNLKTIVLAGGVAANRELRAKFEKESGLSVYFPSHHLCTDNAAMVAAAAFFHGENAKLNIGAYSRQPVRD